MNAGTMSESEALVWNTINDFHERLNEILRTNQITHDYALLSGFLTFVHSKLLKMTENNLNKQKQLYRQYKEYPSEMTEIFDNHTTVLILDALWGKIYYPIFKWFQTLRNFIVPRKAGEQPKYFEFRKMSSKISKFYKEVQAFLNSIISLILMDPEIEATDGVPPQVFVFFNLKKKAAKALPKKLRLSLKYNDPLANIVRLVLHRCILYLGSAQRYKIMYEKISNRHSVEDFVKSKEYFDLASLLLPSSGETFLQRGMVYIQTDNLGTAVQEFIKGSLAKSPCPAALSNFKTIILENDSTLHLRLDKLILDVHSQDLKGTKIVNREIIELYFLAIFGSYFAPDVWTNPKKPGFLRNGLAVKTLELTLYEKIASRYIKNIETIYNDLIIGIGGFNLLQLFGNMGPDSRVKILKSNTLTRNQLSYLSFVFTYITRIITDVIKEAWNGNHEVYLYLAMLRIIGCWIFANESVLEFAKSNVAFCQAYADLLNDFLASGLVSYGPDNSVKPKRSYLFEEDIQLRELGFIGDELDDFNDTKIHTSEDCMTRLVGKPHMEDKLSPKEEKLARLSAIIVTGKQILSYNQCDIHFDTEKTQYKIPDSGIPDMKFKNNVQKNGRNKSGKQTGAVRHYQQEVKDTLKEKTLTKNYQQSSSNFSNAKGIIPTEQNSSVVYSGISVKAPSTFDIKPSFQMKQPGDTLAQDLGNLNLNSPMVNSVSPSYYANTVTGSAIQNSGSEMSTGHINDRSALNAEDEHRKYLNEIFRPNVSMSSVESSRRNSSLKGYLSPNLSANMLSSVDQSITTPTSIMDSHRSSYGLPSWSGSSHTKGSEVNELNSGNGIMTGNSLYYDGRHIYPSYHSRMMSMNSETTIVPDAPSPFADRNRTSFADSRGSGYAEQLLNSSVFQKQSSNKINARNFPTSAQQLNVSNSHQLNQLPNLAQEYGYQNSTNSPYVNSSTNINQNYMTSIGPDSMSSLHEGSQGYWPDQNRKDPQASASSFQAQYPYSIRNGQQPMDNAFINTGFSNVYGPSH